MMRLAALLVALPCVAGCSSIEFYAQAVSGQFEVMWLATPIDERLQESGTPPALREKLKRVLVIRDFASRELALPENDSYRKYADLGRPFVLWNVFAAPEFSVMPVQSCFPVAGCVSYRGFYSEEAAHKHADALAKEGDDIYVGGVTAYSTLGWFSDPVLSTFVNYPEPEVARILFHELAHQEIYVKGDTVFNESFAVAVEEEGLRRWLDREGTPAQRVAYVDSRKRQAEFASLVLKYRARLADFYAQSLTAEEKRDGKRRLFAEMSEEYGALKTSWGGYAGFDRLIARGLNNAFLVSISSYTELLPAFRALLAREKGDLPAFYRAVKDLSKLEKAERDSALSKLAASPGR